MNFLAHAYLSGDQHEILVGNVAGDFIKGRQALMAYGPGIVRGVELHRAIDEYTDAHPVVRKSKDRLRPGYRHYAGVIVDVFYDHFLAALWDHHHTQSLETFAANTYETLDEYSHVLPSQFNTMLSYMKAGNWLVSYRRIPGVHRALSGMASRTPYTSHMERASQDLEQYYEDFMAEFERFFPALKEFSQDWLSQAR